MDRTSRPSIHKVVWRLRLFLTFSRKCKRHIPSLRKIKFNNRRLHKASATPKISFPQNISKVAQRATTLATMPRHSAPTVTDYPPTIPPVSTSRPLSYPEPHEPVSPIGSEPVTRSSPVSPLTSNNSLPVTAPTQSTQSQPAPIDHSEPVNLPHQEADTAFYHPDEPFSIPHQTAQPPPSQTRCNHPSSGQTDYWHPSRRPYNPPHTQPPYEHSTGCPSVQQPPAQQQLAQPKPARPRHRQPPPEMSLEVLPQRTNGEWRAIDLLEAQNKDKLARQQDGRNCKRYSLAFLALLVVIGAIFGAIYGLVIHGRKEDITSP